MITVRKDDGNIESFNRNKIIDSIRKETGCTGEVIESIVDEVYNTLKVIRISPITGPLIREFVNTKFLEYGLEDCRRKYTRVGMPIYDARMVDIGGGKGDNANLQRSPETVHKRKADQLAKEQALLMLPSHLSEAHLNGNIHIHDLEYLTSRYFCADWDLRYVFYYGFTGDGTGDHTSVAGPAMRPEVAVLHASKTLGSGQVNFAGGEGFYNFLTFIAPYFKDCSYKRIKQNMQMLIYEMTQMLVSRGGQSLAGKELLVIKHNGKISLIQIDEFCHKYIRREGAYVFNNDDKTYETLSLNRGTGELEWKKINGVFVHKPRSQLKETRLTDGRSVITTSDHSLFTLDNMCNIVEVSPNECPLTILSSKNIPYSGNDIDQDLMFLIGACISDGNLFANNGIKDSAININVSSEMVYERIQQTVQRYGVSNCGFVPVNEQKKLFHLQFGVDGIPYITEIGHDASNKHIPNQLLSASDASLYALLDGLLSTDRNLARKRYEYNTTSIILAHQIEFILRRLGLDYSINCIMKSNISNKNYPVYVIRISACSSSKLNVTNENKQFRSLNGDVIPDIWNKVKNVLPMEVKSISPVPDEKFVYDIGVDGNENFVLHNGIVCHNTVFSSVQLSPSVPEMWRDKPAVYKGKVGPEMYGEFEKEVRLLFKAFMEVMIEGDYAGKPFYFPKPEIAFEPEYITRMEQEDNQVLPYEIPSIRELYLLSFELASKFGTPYFDNMIPPYRGAGKGISCMQCCSFSFSSGSEGDPDFNNKLYFKDGKHFTMGSAQVITLNMPRYAYESNGDLTQYMEICKTNIDLAIEVFKIKRDWITECIQNGMIPFPTHTKKDPNTGKLIPPFLDLNDYVFTIGIVGMNEVCEIMLGKPIYSDHESQMFAMKICSELNKYCKQMSKKHDIKLSFSRTPAETTAQRFAVLDLLNYGNAHSYVKGDIKEAIKTYAETGSRDLPIYYTNGTHCPVDAPISITEKIKIEQAFFPILDGGNICNLYLGEARPDPRGLMDLTLKICKTTNLGYFAFTKDFTVCNNAYEFYES